MTDDQHQEGMPGGGGRWDPLPHGDYDDGATAFVNLPEGGIDALLDSPLAAPGHGYVPPQITVTPTAAGTDPGAVWPSVGPPADGAQWHDPAMGGQDTSGGDRFTYQSGASGPWEYHDGGTGEDASPAGQRQSAPGQDVTGQWSIPVAGGDLPDESGEFTASSLVEQWGGTPPPTLPGGAPAPWATQPTGQPWGTGSTGQPADYGPPAEHGHPAPGHSYGDPDPAGPHLPHHLADPAQAQPYGGPAEQYFPDTEPYARKTEPYAQDPGVLGGQPVPGYEHAPAPVAHPEPADPAHQDQGDPAAAPQHLAEQGLAEPHVAEQGLADQHFADQVPQHPAEAYEAAPPAGQPEPQPGPQDPAATGEAAPEDARSAPEEAVAEPAAADDAADGVPEGTGPAENAAGTDGPAAPEEPAPHDAAGAGTEAAEGAGQPAATLHDDHPLASYVLRVNGTDRPVTDAWIGESLLYVLRERLGLAGAKDGCSQGECGACNVQVDGRLVASCLVPSVTAAGSEVRTVEGLATDGRPSDVQRALARCGAVQCGFCVPGMAMTVHDLLEGNPAPTELETRQALCGNLCRCSGYRGVVAAVKEVVAEREAHHAAEASDPDADGPRVPHQAGPGAGGVHSTAFGGPQPQGHGGQHDQSHDPDHDQPHGPDGGHP
ncbi:MAG TPA: 2Fe-2S iron-sulfur cluster-binding protein [Streptomyces sp.]|nr:2Fe-2S iron-sulfur cluster-binding protein [Streptomyces sp.]